VEAVEVGFWMELVRGIVGPSWSLKVTLVHGAGTVLIERERPSGATHSETEWDLTGTSVLALVFSPND